MGLNAEHTALVIAVGAHGVEIADVDKIDDLAAHIRLCGLELRNGGKLG